MASTNSKSLGGVPGPTREHLREVNSFYSNDDVMNHIGGLGPKDTVDPTSMCSLLTRRVTQSTNIRLGNELENVHNMYILSSCDVTDIRPKNKKGVKQKDLLIEKDGGIIYAEFKSNLNLDTEKRLATRNKVNAIAEELKCTRPECEIRPFLVSLRYLTKSDIPAHMYSTYSDVELIGIRDMYNDILEHPMAELEDYTVYKRFLMTIVDQLEPDE
jgi:hypothetical protein